MRGFGIVAFVVLLSAVGCSHYEIRKVPSKWEREANGGQWTADDQRAVESMEGLRFYMSRAYVAVHKPFPIGADTVIVHGKVSTDGKYIAIDALPAAADAKVTPAIRKYLETIAPRPGDWKIDAKSVSVSAPTAARPMIAESESGAIDSGAALPGAQGAVNEDPNAAGGAAKDKTEGGVESFELRTDLTAQSTIPMRDFFDVTYMPDYTEQYVIHGDANAGMLEMKVVWGPGNTLISMDAKLDNSAIIGPLLDLYSGLVKQGGQALKQMILPGAQGSAEKVGERPQEYAGTDVSLAIHVIRFAAPGLYPVLKPQEYESAKSAAGAAVADQIIVGHPPATMVSYKYYETVVVECLSAGGSAAMDLIDHAIDREPRKIPAGSAKATTSTGTIAEGEITLRASDEQLRAINLEVASTAPGFFAQTATYEPMSGTLQVVFAQRAPDDESVRLKLSAAAKTGWTNANQGSAVPKTVKCSFVGGDS